MSTDPDFSPPGERVADEHPLTPSGGDNADSRSSLQARHKTVPVSPTLRAPAHQKVAGSNTPSREIAKRAARRLINSASARPQSLNGVMMAPPKSASYDQRLVQRMRSTGHHLGVQTGKNDNFAIPKAKETMADLPRTPRQASSAQSLLKQEKVDSGLAPLRPRAASGASLALDSDVEMADTPTRYEAGTGLNHDSHQHPRDSSVLSSVPDYPGAAIYPVSGGGLRQGSASTDAVHSGRSSFNQPYDNLFSQTPAVDIEQLGSNPDESVRGDPSVKNELDLNVLARGCVEFDDKAPAKEKYEL
jgi:hypothetical protein